MSKEKVTEGQQPATGGASDRSQQPMTIAINSQQPATKSSGEAKAKPAPQKSED